MNFNYKEKSDCAYKLHTQNKLDEAQKLYLELLEVRPDDVNILNLLGLLYLSKSVPDKAVECLSKAFVLNQSEYICTNLAKAYYFNNEFEKSIKLYKQALQYGETDDIYYSMAISYKKLGDFTNVIKCYEKAIEINPDNVNALYNISLAYKQQNDIKKALYYAEKCLQLNKNDENLYSLLSGYYEDLGNYKSAVSMLEKAFELNKNNYLYLYNLGVLYSRLNDSAKALDCYNKSIEINPDYIESYVNAASLLKGKNDDKALEYLIKAYEKDNNNEKLLLSLAQTLKDLFENERSIEISNKIIRNNPLCSEAYSLLGINYMDIGEYEIALSEYEKALEYSPDNLNYLHGKAIALKYLGKEEESKQLLEYIVKHDRVSTQSIVSLGMVYLTEKDFKTGMKLYRKRSEENNMLSVFKDKIWDYGVNVKNKNVLVYTNCGLGDTIMYARYLLLLKNIVKKLTVQTDKELVSVLQYSFPDIEVIKKGITPPEYDCVVPMMDIQLVLDSDFTNIPYSEGYLKAKETETPSCLDTKLKKTGMFWQGNKKIFKNRSIDLSFYEPLMNNENIMFYSFQIDKDIHEKANFKSLKPYIADYSDTASLLSKLDVLITIDSSIAHMAGALSVKTFLLLPKIAEWRWFKDDKTTPWYNSMRIFRQKENGNWQEVIERVKREL